MASQGVGGMEVKQVRDGEKDGEEEGHKTGDTQKVKSLFLLSFFPPTILLMYYIHVCFCSRFYSSKLLFASAIFWTNQPQHPLLWTIQSFLKKMYRAQSSMNDCLSRLRRVFPRAPSAIFFLACKQAHTHSSQNTLPPSSLEIMVQTLSHVETDWTRRWVIDLSDSRRGVCIFCAKTKSVLTSCLCASSSTEVSYTDGVHPTQKASRRVERRTNDLCSRPHCLKPTVQTEQRATKKNRAADVSRPTSLGYLLPHLALSTAIA